MMNAIIRFMNVTAKMMNTIVMAVNTISRHAIIVEMINQRR